MTSPRVAALLEKTRRQDAAKNLERASEIWLRATEISSTLYSDMPDDITDAAAAIEHEARRLFCALGAYAEALNQEAEITG